MLIYSADVVIDAIGDDYDNLVGRDPTPAETAFYLASYRTDPSLDDIRVGIARTPDARAALAAAYLDTVGSEPNAAQLDALQQSLVGGATLDDVTAALAASLPPGDEEGGSPPGDDDTRDALNGLYQAVLGRDGDEAGLDYWQGFVAQGATITDVRVALAMSDEARNAVGGLYRNVLGHDGDNAGITYWQGDLAGGSSIDDVRADLASSDEAGQAVGKLYEAVLGRPGDALGISFWQQRLIGGADLDDVRQALAASTEVAGDLRSATLAITGAPLGTAALAGYVARLAAGTADLGEIRSEIAAPDGASATVAVDATTLGTNSTLIFVSAVQPLTLVAAAQPETFVVDRLLAAVVIQGFDPAKDALQFSATQFANPTAMRTAFAATLAGHPQGGTLLLAGQSDVSAVAIRVG